MSTHEQWLATWRELGAAAPAGLYEELMARYAEPHRHYHTLRHLEECFAELPAVRADAARPAEVELALWFHDAIYDTTRHDNEQRSAELARSVVAQAGLDASVGERVAALIMATRHDAASTDADAAVLVDVDLSILGAPPLRFDEYEREVRKEYAQVPEALFRRERRKILRRLLERPHLYNTPQMRESHERRARANLERSITRLKPNLRTACDLAMAVVAIVLLAMLPASLDVPVEWAAGAVVAMSLLYYIGIRPRLYSPALGLPRAKAADSRYAVTCDDEGLAVTLDDKTVDSVRWADVTAVLIRIDEQLLPQPWWIVRGSSGGCMYPNDARGTERALEILPARLPGFDYAAVIKAMGLDSGGVVVWTRAGAARDGTPHES
jgi:predicted metal-dependent HD superfamily phosphohydrolase